MKKLLLLLLFLFPPANPTDTPAAEGDHPPIMLNVRAPDPGPTTRAYFYSSSSNETRLLAFQKKLVDAGASHVNCFLPSVIVCDLPTDRNPRELISDPDIVFAPETSIERTSARSTVFGLQWVKQVYEMADETPAEYMDAPMDLPHEAPSVTAKIVPHERVYRYLDTQPETVPNDEVRNMLQNTELMTGIIFAQLVFPESVGQQENWTPAALSDATSRATLAMMFYQNEYQNAPMHLVVRKHEQVHTEFEPINFNPNDDEVWVGDLMWHLGYRNPDGALERVHDFNNAMRAPTNADWVFTAFIVNSENDPDHWFSGTTAGAFANIGGPYMVVAHPVGRPKADPGVGDFAQSFKHHYGLVFWALPEHSEAPGTCLTRSGYLSQKNLNKTVGFDGMGNPKGCEPGLPDRCIMNRLDAMLGLYAGPPCEYTSGMLGLSDANRNGVPDGLDRGPTFIFETAGVETVTTSSVTLPFRAVSEGVRNRNPGQDAPRRNYALPVELAGRSRNGVLTQRFQPLDGVADELEEEFNLTVSLLPSGLSSIELIAKTTARATTVFNKRIYFLGLTYRRFRVDHHNNGTKLAWNMFGETFDARFDVHRVDVATGLDEILSTVDEPSDDPSGPFTPYSFDDRGVVPGRAYRYYVIGEFEADFEGQLQVFSDTSQVFNSTAMLGIASNGLLSDVAPNPFRNRTQISIDVPPSFKPSDDGTTFLDPIPTRVEAIVYDALGRRVKTLYKGGLLGQVLTVGWDGTNGNNQPVPSGVYFLKVNAGKRSDSRKIVLLK